MFMSLHGPFLRRQVPACFAVIILRIWVKSSFIAETREEEAKGGGRNRCCCLYVIGGTAFTNDSCNLESSILIWRIGQEFRNQNWIGIEIAPRRKPLEISEWSSVHQVFSRITTLCIWIGYPSDILNGVLQKYPFPFHATPFFFRPAPISHPSSPPITPRYLNTLGTRQGRDTQPSRFRTVERCPSDCGRTSNISVNFHKRVELGKEEGRGGKKCIEIS